MIRNQLIVQFKNKRMKERLWAARNPTLQEAIEIAKVVEEAELCMKEMQQIENKQTTEGVNFINKKEVQAKTFKDAKVREKCEVDRTKKRVNSMHADDYKGCYASDKDYRKCRKRGHSAIMCKEMMQNKVTCVDEQELMPENVLCIQSKNEVKITGPKAIFTLNEKEIELMVDPGSRLPVSRGDEDQLDQEVVCVVNGVKDALEGNFEVITQEEWKAAVRKNWLSVFVMLGVRW
ncbi:hypothetical protein NDU88_000343 [Pleurodeles waltl]|uniref:Uncharacterized protein n=1 Tax=Pleurodeles waltl TaxID=8319 RepID=A0AAV7P3X5_PLEWA|nr:hypothetical protein NDU88_000343 [Pleurodeles waltl]